MNKSQTKKGKKKPPSVNSFHVTIGAAPSIKRTEAIHGRQVSLDHELRLVKAALLYADSATLCSMSASMLISMLAMGTITTRQKIDFLRSMLPILSKNIITEETLDNWDKIVKSIDQKGKLSPELLAFIQQFEEQVDTGWIEFTTQIEELARVAGAEELLRAVQSGFLKVHLLGATPVRGKPIIKIPDTVKRSSSNDRMLIEYVDFISRAVASGTTYPLFDDLTGNFIYNAIKEERLTISNIGAARGKHSVLAGNLLERLPLFDEATIDEIIDIRTELSQSLVRFRQAVIGFSEEMKYAAWERDFPAEADQLFHKRIAPTVLEIEEKIKSTRSLANFLERFVKKPLASGASGGVISVMLSDVFAAPELAKYALTGGLASAAVTTIVEYREILRERHNLAENQLYFYYRAGKLLSE